MKTINQLSVLISICVLSYTLNAQSLAEKKYDLNDYGGIALSSSKYIPFGTPGQIIASSSLQTAPSDPKTVIVRVDDEGYKLWGTEYDPPGNEAFDRNSLIRSHRVGYNTNSDSGYGGENAVIVVGEIKDNYNYKPAYIEIKATNGDVKKEVVFDKNGGTGRGHLSAIHTLPTGSYKGTYMVGALETGSPLTYAPVLVKIGSTGNLSWSAARCRRNLLSRC